MSIDQGSNAIHAFTIEASGTLTPLAGSPFSTGPERINPKETVADPDGRFLYVANFDAGSMGNVFGVHSRCPERCANTHGRRLQPGMNPRRS